MIEIKNIISRINDLKTSFSINQRKESLVELESRVGDPELWNKPKEAKIMLKKIKSIRFIIQQFIELEITLKELEVSLDLLNEGLIKEEETAQYYTNLLNQIEQLESQSMLNQEEDSMSAILKINSGAGGIDAMDWASMLTQMYICWAKSHKFEVTVSSKTKSEFGIKSITLKIEGEYVYGLLKGEEGVHRLVRVSPFNSQRKRMTSFASISVVPLIDDSIEITIDKSKLSWDTFRSSGPGGQNVNKVESGVRLHYLLNTGEEIRIENTETRDQSRNREKALELLKSKLYQIELDKRLDEQTKIEEKKKKIEWGSQIRSYVLDDKRVKDHRTGTEIHDTESVLRGNIDIFIKKYLMNSYRK